MTQPLPLDLAAALEALPSLLPTSPQTEAAILTATGMAGPEAAGPARRLDRALTKTVRADALSARAIESPQGENAGSDDSRNALMRA